MFQDDVEMFEMERYSGLGTPLHSAAGSGHLDMVELLLQRGADPLIKNSMGLLPIEVAEYHGRSAVTALLRPLSDLPVKSRHR